MVLTKYLSIRRIKKKSVEPVVLRNVINQWDSSTGQTTGIWPAYSLLNSGLEKHAK